VASYWSKLVWQIFQKTKVEAFVEKKDFSKIIEYEYRKHIFSSKRLQKEDIRPLGRCVVYGLMRLLLVLLLFLYNICESIYTGYWESSASILGGWSAIASSGSGQRVYSTQSSGGIYLSTNFGKSYVRTTAPNKNWRGIASSDSGVNVLAISDDYYYSLSRSTDGGGTWIDSNQIPNCLCWTAIAMSYSGQYSVAVGLGIGVYWTKDFGNTWSGTVNPSLELQWRDVVVSSDGVRVIAASYDKGIWFSLNYGESWGQCVAPQSIGWTSVALSGDGSTILAVNERELGGVYQGLYFSCSPLRQIASIQKKNFSNVAMSNTSQYVVLGSPYFRYSYASNDTGFSWNYTYNSPTCNALSSTHNGRIVFSADSTGYLSYYIPGSHASTASPSSSPTSIPSSPSLSPTIQPSTPPTYFPTSQPAAPSLLPSLSPTWSPTVAPSSSPTLRPSLLPTLSPTCARGRYQVDSATNGTTCMKCPAGTYSTQTNSTERGVCQDCPYPSYSLSAGSSQCSAIALSAPVDIVWVLGSCFVMTLIIVLIIAKQSCIAIILVLLFPLLDLYTDLIYLCSTLFYNGPLAIACALCLVHPVATLMYRLVKMQVPIGLLRYIWVLGYGQSLFSSTQGSGRSTSGDRLPYPTLCGHRFYVIKPIVTHSNILLLLLEIVLWIFALTIQAITIVTIPIAVCLWLLVGVYLESTKLMTLSWAWNWWIEGWALSPNWNDIGQGGVDTARLNRAILIEFFVETLPQLTLQGVNNSLVGSWGQAIGIVSFCVSCLMSLNVAYKYAYHTALQAEPMPLSEIPPSANPFSKLFRWLAIGQNLELAPYTMRFARQAGKEDIERLKVHIPSQA
jgi:hypothetical protein